jgi:hypothetical protein
MERSEKPKSSMSLPPEILAEIMYRLPSSKDIYNLTLSHKNAYLGQKRTNILKKKYDEETEQAILQATKEMFPRMKPKSIADIPVSTILEIGLLVENLSIARYALERGAKLDSSLMNHFMVSQEFIDSLNL